MQKSLAAEVRQAISPLNGFAAFDCAPALEEPEADCAIRLIENRESYVVLATIPNVGKEDIRVCVNGNRVVLSAAHRSFRALASGIESLAENWGTAMDDEDMHVIHNFLFDQNIEVARAQATYRNGELELILPKSNGAGKRLLIN